MRQVLSTTSGLVNNLLKETKLFTSQLKKSGYCYIFPNISFQKSNPDDYSLKTGKCVKKIHMYKYNYIYKVRCVGEWNALPAGVVEAESLESFKRRLDAHMAEEFCRVV